MLDLFELVVLVVGGILIAANSGKELWRKLVNASAIGCAVGALAFLVGFIGPLIFMPTANQGPLIGFLTGPLGVVVGWMGTMLFYTWKQYRHPR